MMPRDDAIAARDDASRALTTPATTTDRDDRAPRVDDVFSTRRPKDFGAGLSSGLQSAAKSVALGAGALLTAPVVGAREDGARGFVKGLGLGVASAIVLPVVGASVGVAQIARGAVNTPSAVAARARGERFDRKTREWVAEDLARDGAFLGETSDGAIFERAVKRAETRGARPGIGGMLEEAAGSSGGGARETEYYDALEVSPTATSAEIRRKYYLLARKMHPDKNPNDPTAKARFQEIGEAYQVLSDESLRRKYDARGKDALGDVPIVNPAAFFGMLFGSEQMEGFVGRLQLASLAMAGTDLTGDEQDLLQKRREARLAIKLAAMCDVYVDIDSKMGTEKERAAQFVETMRPVAQTLANASFGQIMVQKIGWVYAMEAEKFLHDPLAGTGTWLDLGLRSTGVTMQQKASKWKNKFSALKAGVNIFSTVQSSEAEVQKATNEQQANELRAKQQRDVLPHVLDALWSTSSVDIESTLRHVCSKVLHDASVAQSRRAGRAKALLYLGKMFQETKSTDPKAKDAAAVLEDALRAAFEPERGADDA
jgi:curved DNA-binding protein CbpA